MKKVFFLLAVILLPCVSMGQKKAKSYVGVTFGINATNRDNQKTDLNDPTSGFAFGGGFAEINSAYFIFNKLGIAFNATVAGNGVNDSAFYDAMYEKHDLNPKDQYSSRFRGTSWTNLLIGPEFSIPVGKFHFDFRAMTGVLFVYPDDFSLVYTEQEWGKKIQFKQEGENTSAIGYRGGIGIRMGGKNIAFRLSYDFIFSQPLIKVTRHYYDESAYYSNQRSTSLKLTEEFKYRKTIANSLIGLGIVFQFNRK